MQRLSRIPKGALEAISACSQEVWMGLGRRGGNEKSEAQTAVMRVEDCLGPPGPPDDARRGEGWLLPESLLTQ